MLFMASSAEYLFRLWPLFLNKILYATEAELRPFVWIGELPDTLTRVTGLLRRIHRHEQAHRATPEAKSELCRACAATAGDLQALK